MQKMCKAFVERVLCHAEDAIVLQMMCNASMKHHAQPMINVSLPCDSSTRMWQASDGAEICLLTFFPPPHLLLV